MSCGCQKSSTKGFLILVPSLFSFSNGRGTLQGLRLQSHLRGRRRFWTETSSSFEDSIILKVFVGRRLPS